MILPPEPKKPTPFAALPRRFEKALDALPAPRPGRPWGVDGADKGGGSAPVEVGEEATFHDGKQYLGLQDPQVWSEGSVRRSRDGVVLLQCRLLWDALHGERHESPRRERPWCGWAIRPAFAEIRRTSRLASWRGRCDSAGSSDQGGQPRVAELLDLLDSLLHWLAAVR